jgi:hypothetical protein
MEQPANHGSTKHPGQPVVALGALWVADPAAWSTSNKSGASDPTHVTKPVDTNLVLRLTARTCTRRRGPRPPKWSVSRNEAPDQRLLEGRQEMMIRLRA